MNHTERFSPESPWWVVLGLPKYADKTVIKEHYKALAQKYHPDKLEGNKELMQIINIAFERSNASQDSTNDSHQAESKTSSNPCEHFDFRQYRTGYAEKIQDSDLWDSSEDFPIAWGNILESFVYLPEAQIQLPVLKAISLVPSAMASKNLPIVFLSGNPETGKSRIMEMVGNVHGVGLISVSSTYASVRNVISLNKYGSITGTGIERNTVFLFDNVLASTFDDEKLYGLMLGGYDRKTSKILISGGVDAGNLTFDIFGLSVISSIVAVEKDSRYSELRTRMLPLFTQQCPQGMTIEATENYDFSDVPNLYKSFWTNPDILGYYVATRKKVKPKLQIADLTPRRKAIILEIITTGVVCKIWDSIPDAIDNLKAQFALANQFARETPLEIAIREVLTQYSKTYHGGVPADVIQAKVIADELGTSAREKLLDSRDVVPAEIRRIMKTHGYELHRNKWRLAS